jgi:hypothetical protein
MIVGENKDLIGCTGYDVVDCGAVGDRDHDFRCCLLHRRSIYRTDLSTKVEAAFDG